jgi:hypothetical protein
MSYDATINGKHPKNKKELREALASNPLGVRFHNHSLFGLSAWSGWPEDMPEGSIITVVIPHVYDRKYFATVARKGGKVTLK